MPSYFDLQNSPVLTTPSTLTVPKITSIGYPGDDTAADTAGGQTITLTGSGFVAGASVIINGAAVGVVSVVSSTTITFTSPAQSAGSYVLYVVNTDGSTAVAVPGIQYSGTPTWTTAAGSLGSYTETVAIANTVTATGDAPVTYSVFSGSLPTGATLNSANGYISGTSPAAASPTTYTFTIRATDAQQQDTNRSFSLTINPDAVTWSSPANGTTYASVANTALANVPLSASAASGQNITYTANALPTGLSISGSNITGTPTVVANSSTLLTATAATTNATATRTINWVISVASDTYFPYVTSLLSASTPTSTFVTDASTNAFAVTVNGDTRPSNFGPYTPGYYSGLFAGASNQSVTIATAANSNIGAIAGTRITYEYWFYCTTIQPITAWYVGVFGNFQAVAANGRIAIGLAGSSATSPVAVYFYWTTSTSTTDIVSTTATVNQNSWNHVAVSIDATTASSSTITIYLNGVGQTFTGKNLSTHTTDPGIAYAIGGDYSYQNFTGYLSNFRVTRGATVYSGNFTPSTTPFTTSANTVLLALQSNRFIDTSTNAYALTPNSGPQISGFDPFVPSSSFAGRGSAYFDGSGDSLSISADACPRGTEDFTIEFWYYPLSLSSAERYFVVGDGSNALLFGITYSGNDIGVIRNVSGAGVVNFGSRTQLTVNAWNYIAVTRSGTTFRCYINGSPTTTPSGTSDYSFATPSTTTIGAGSTFGNITDLRIVRGTALYTGATMTVPTAPLTAVANTSLLTLQNNQPNNNNMFLDGSTNNFNITRNGNTTQGTFSPYGGGWSNYFDGSGDYLTYPSNAAFTFGTGDFTVEAWIYVASTVEFNIFNIGGAATGSYSLYFNTISKFESVRYGDPAGSGTTTNTYARNQWYHVAAVRSSGTAKLYINGTEDTGSTYSMGNITASAAESGRIWQAPAVNNGYISNLRIVKGTAVYTSNFTPPTAPLTPIANTQLLTCADNRFIDDSPNNFTVTRNGDTSIQRFNPFNPVLTTPTSYSAYFDGTGDKLTLPSSSNLAFGTGDFCVEAWTYFNANPAERMIFGNISNSETQFAFRIDSSGYPKVQSWFTNYAISNTAVVTNQWYHLVACRVSNTLSIFINGTRTATATVSNNFSSTDAFEIGGKVGNDFVNGYISNLRVTKGSSPYNPTQTTITVPATPLTAIANTQLLTLQSPTFTDNSTNNFTITAVGDTAPRQFNPFGWTSTTGSSAAYTPALYGGSGYFDGTGDYLSITDNAAFEVGSGSFTLECWFYITGSNPANGANIVSKSNSSSFGPYAIGFKPTGELQALSSTSGSSWEISLVTSGISFSSLAGRWNHVAYVRNGTSFVLYLNGVSVATATSSGTLVDNTNAFMVGYINFASTEFPGYISDVRLTKGQARYTSNFQPPIAPLTAIQNTVLLNNMTGAGIYDSSMMNDYETVGNSSISTSVKKYGNSSMYFDGSGDYLVSSPDPNLSFGTSDFTVEMWVYLNSGSAYQYVIGATANGGMQIGLNVPISGTPTIAVATANGSWILNFGASITIPSATWRHIAVTRSGSTNRAFINGVQLGSNITDSTNWTFPNNRLQVGATLGAESFAGYIDDLRITKGIARYTANFTPPTTPFITN